MINQTIRHTVESELRSDEKLLWADKPAKNPISFMAIYITAFSVVWTLFVLIFISLAAIAALSGAEGTEGLGFVFLFVPLVFLCVGVGMIFTGVKMLISPGKEIYALTDQRGIIISPFMKYRVASLSSQSLNNSERKGGPDIGTLTFGKNSNNWMGIWMNPYQSELISFHKISKPKQVEDLIHKTFFEKRVTP